MSDDIYAEGRQRFIEKLKSEMNSVIAEVAYAEAQYELASCLPTIEFGYDDYQLLVKAGVTTSAAQLSGQIELLRARWAALGAAIEVMTAEA